MLIMRLRDFDRTVAIERLVRTVNFVGNALSGGTQDTDPKFGEIVFVDTLDRMAHQEVQNNGVDTEFGADALEQPAKIVRRDAGALTTRSLALAEYPNERLSQLRVSDVQQLVGALGIE
jgi:hypothetical protein